jgi:hypothetical protein
VKYKSLINFLVFKATQWKPNIEIWWFQKIYKSHFWRWKLSKNHFIFEFFAFWRSFRQRKKGPPQMMPKIIPCSHFSRSFLFFAFWFPTGPAVQSNRLHRSHTEEYLILFGSKFDFGLLAGMAQLLDTLFTRIWVQIISPWLHQRTCPPILKLKTLDSRYLLGKTYKVGR